MSNKKIIAVVGATGAQGGGLVRAILADPHGGFSARAITRNVDSDKAKALSALGAQVVAADLDNPESVKKAFDGAHGVFCITNFWEHFSAEREMAQAKTMADSAKSAGVQHVIWSTLEDTRILVPLSDNRMPTLQGKYKVPHFDGKGEADKYFAQTGVPTTYLLTSFYWENFIFFGMGPTADPTGKLSITMPLGNALFPSMAVDDIGKCAYGMFKRGSEFAGKRVGIAGEHITGAQMAVAFAGALGKEVSYNAIEPDVYRGLGFPGADDLGNMFQYNRDFATEFCNTRNLQTSRELNPALQIFDKWLSANITRIPIK